jgi:hypothetical protein
MSQVINIKSRYKQFHLLHCLKKHIQISIIIQDFIMKKIEI